MIHRKHGRGLSLAVAVLFLVAACGGADAENPGESPSTEGTSGGDETASGTDSTAPSSSEPIVYWKHEFAPADNAVEKFVVDYEALTGQQIEFESIPYGDYFVRLGATLEAGTGPCVSLLPANIVAEFVERGEIVPIPDEVLSDSEIESEFIPATMALLSVNDEYYGLPSAVQTFVLFYNDDLFIEAGLDPTEDFATWEDFRAAAIALTKTDGGEIVQAGVDIMRSPYQFYWHAPVLAYQDGLVSPDFSVEYDSEPGYETWRRMTDLVLVDGVDSSEFLAGQDPFLAGLAGMTLRETGSASQIQQGSEVNYSVHPAPLIADENFGSSVITQWAFTVTKDCHDPQAAWEWVKYLTSEEAQLVTVSTGVELPSRLSLVDNDELRQDPNVAAALDSLVDSVAFDSYGWDDAWAIHQNIWERIVLNGESVEDAVNVGANAEREMIETKGLS